MSAKGSRKVSSKANNAGTIKTGNKQIDIPVWRRWLYRIILSVVVPVLFVLLLEGVLRLVNYGYSTSFFLKWEVEGKEYLSHNNNYTQQFFPPRLVRRPAQFVFSEKKQQGTTRIFVFGESAAQGEPKFAFGFTRMLELMLADRYPDRKFEVINTGITAINSNVILPIARESAKHDADLFIVYAGNNEVVGPYGPSTSFNMFMSNLNFIRSNVWLKSTKIGTMLDNIKYGFMKGDQVPKEWGGMEMFMKTRVRYDDRKMASVYEHFTRNVDDVITAGYEAGAKVIACTVATNIKDCPPLGSMNAPVLKDSDLKQWKQLYASGVELENAKDYKGALGQYQAAEKIDESYADLQYRMGRCYLATGDKVNAKQSFIKARDFDTLRFRADTRINNTIRDLAARHSSQGVYLMDIEKAFEANSDDGLPGDKLLLEHVHMTFEGNYLIAKELLSQIEKIYPEGNSGKVTAMEECEERLAYSKLDHYLVLDTILSRFKSAPFTGQIDNDKAVKSLEEKLKLLEGYKDISSLGEIKQVYGQALSKRPDDYIIRNNYASLLLGSGDEKQLEAALEQLKAILKVMPFDHATLNNVGIVYAKQGNYSEAEKYFRKALRYNPNDTSARKNLLLALQKQGK